MKCRIPSQSRNGSAGLAGLKLMNHPPEAIGFTPFKKLERGGSIEGRKS
jgi:hypothetical protein